MSISLVKHLESLKRFVFMEKKFASKLPSAPFSSLRFVLVPLFPPHMLFTRSRAGYLDWLGDASVRFLSCDVQKLLSAPCTDTDKPLKHV